MGVFYEIDVYFLGELTEEIEAEINVICADYYPEIIKDENGFTVNAQVKPYDDGDRVKAQLQLIKIKYGL